MKHDLLHKLLFLLIIIFVSFLIIEFKLNLDFNNNLELKQNFLAKLSTFILFNLFTRSFDLGALLIDHYNYFL